MSDILKTFCSIAATLVEVTEEENGKRFTKNDNITLSFESDGRKHTVCITVEEEKE